WENAARPASNKTASRKPDVVNFFMKRVVLKITYLIPVIIKWQPAGRLPFSLLTVLDNILLFCFRFTCADLRFSFVFFPFYFIPFFFVLGVIAFFTFVFAVPVFDLQAAFFPFHFTPVFIFHL